MDDEATSWRNQASDQEIIAVAAAGLQRMEQAEIAGERWARHALIRELHRIQSHAERWLRQLGAEDEEAEAGSPAPAAGRAEARAKGPRGDGG